MSTNAEAHVYEFGLRDRLRVTREAAGFNQQEFATLTGISRNSIVNYEMGHTIPRRPVIVSWALATGFDAGWLETGTQPIPEPPDGGMNADATPGHARTGVDEHPCPWDAALALLMDGVAA